MRYHLPKLQAAFIIMLPLAYIAVLTYSTACVDTINASNSQKADQTDSGSPVTTWRYDRGFQAPPAEVCGDWNEVKWTQWLAVQLDVHPDLATEVRTAYNSRCDLIYSGHCYEVEWADKWTEAVGQSQQYSTQLQSFWQELKPGIVLLMKPDDLASVLECSAVCQRKDIRLIIQKVP